LAAAEAFSRLEESPEQYPVYHAGFRRQFILKFPYKVFFRIEKHEVIMFRVLHAARDHAPQLR
jgi:plasmid stabilization system protein ParE